ncbi:MAG: bifunctional oligoribonuclease/PAP phosphatase NrnA [Actinobacteria bacterium]|nr:bifunctional oligoribonuclease/PAP phosphatase NrnA [Actinomycetota bacterium]
MTEGPTAGSVTPAEVAERLRGEKRILAVSHEAPDGDALGCLSAFLLMCEQLGIPCRGYVPGESGIPPEYLFLPKVRGVLRGRPPSLEPETTIYFFDCASLLRSNSHGFPEDVVRINIDHHADNPGYGEYNLVDADAASTTVILHEIFEAGGFSVDREVATALYVGLVTDTGRFQYSNTTPDAHRTAAALQECGVDVAWVYRQVYESTPLPKLLLLERALRHLEVRLGGALAVSWLGNDDFVQTGADEGHAEGLIDTLRRIHGVRVAALVREKSGENGVQAKVSLRSTDGSLNVAELAHKRGGGGHARAAGFTVDEDLATVLDWIETEVGTAL